MAKTSYETNSAEAKKLWDEKLFRETEKESYFKKFEGNSMDSIVYVKNELDKKKGDQITFGIKSRLVGAGVTGRTTLEGNEERLSTYTDTVSLERYRHAIRDDGDLDRQRVFFSIDEESQSSLKQWGSDKIDELRFTAIQAAPTRIVYRDGGATGAIKVTATANTAKTALSATYKISSDMIVWLRTYAETGGNRAFSPLRKVKVNGKKYYVLLVHPDVLHDLLVEDDFKQAQLEAERRSSEHPIFTDAVAIYRGVIIHAHENMDIATDGGGASVPWGKGVLMGAQALCWAWGRRPKVVHKKFDYDEEFGYAWSMTCGVTKPQFNSEDYGSIGVYFSRTAVSDSTLV